MADRDRPVTMVWVGLSLPIYDRILKHLSRGAVPVGAAFVREAPEPQQLNLWQAVGAALTARLGDRPVWLSTAGMGVSWLHVRLDSRPKYYGYAP